MEPPDPSPYDALLARHLVTLPEARLYVGEALREAPWAGIEAAFGQLLEDVAPESILAVYDDSLFGRGRKGFVVTDRHLLVRYDGPGQIVPLGRIEKATVRDERLHVHYEAEGLALRVDVRVDEPAARDAVRAWLAALARANRPHFRARRAEQQQAREAAREEAQRQAEAREAAAWAEQQVQADAPRRLSAHQALARLEQMVERKRLRAPERARLLALAARVQEAEARETGKRRRRKSDGS